jgi:hypothetical protein
MSTVRKVARSASSGRFISARDARRWPQYTVVETISYPSPRRVGRRRSARHLIEENQQERPFKAGRDLRTDAKNKRATSEFKAGKDI